jgi:RNA recognition motif. (a.k.a. RRM, RBD, or RNP domain)
VQSVPDYEVENLLHSDLKKIVLTPEEINKKHPTEYAKEIMRDRMDYRQHVTSDTEFMLFNIPDGVTKDKIIELCSVKGVTVMRAAITPALNEVEVRPAFAYVQVASPAQVNILKERFRNVWIEDKKIKMKSREELNYEVYDHRTIIVRNLPNHYQKKQLLEIFDRYGAIVGVELPVKNLAIEQELKNRLNAHEVKRRQETELVTRRAQKLVKDTIKENVDYYNAIFSNYLGAEEASQMIMSLTSDGQEATETQANRLLDSKRHISIQHMISQLQAEGVQVAKAKQTLIKLKSYTDDSIPALDANLSTRDITSQLT